MSQYVDYDGTESKICPIKTGFPQGSILGPSAIYHLDEWYPWSQFEF